MTTIVYDHKSKQIACDSQLTSKGIAVNLSAKKFITNDIGTWFFTGKDSDSVDLSKLKHNDKVDVSPDCSAILSTDDGVFLVCMSDGGYCEYSPLNYSMTIGSGMDLAIAALDFNCGAGDAVEYAATRCIYTGGKVHVYDIEKGEFI
mgnify:FL=1